MRALALSHRDLFGGLPIRIGRPSVSRRASPAKCVASHRLHSCCIVRRVPPPCPCTYRPPRLFLSCSPKCKSTTRHIVTASVEPPLELDDGCFERPGALVLVESGLYKKSWDDALASAFPRKGVHYMNVDLFSCLANNAKPAPELFSRMHEELRTDISSLAEVVLVARGPLPSLVAQYYLESCPLSGVVLVDPLLAPSQENGMDANRLQQSALQLIELSEASPFQKSTFSACESRLIHDLAKDQYNRPLKLEPGAVPMHILYTGRHANEDVFRKCAIDTAAYHATEDSDEIWGEVVVEKLDNRDNGDCSAIVNRIYQWFHDIV